MKIIKRYELGRLMTFQPDKKRPIFNWMYYKEAFSGRLVEVLLKELNMHAPIFDPFVGVGTVPLECKYNGMFSMGTDASPLAVLASNVKCRNYDDEDLKEIMSESEKILDRVSKESEQEFEWKFELFPPHRAFPQRNLRVINKIRRELDAISSQKVKEFLMVALLSILPLTSYVLKDGGVLKIMKNKRAGDAKYLFKKKIKKMVNDIKTYGVVYDEPEIHTGSARQMNIDDSYVGSIITSPPYLNNIDYTKVYGLELSLAFPKMSVKEVRKNMIRSFIGKKDVVNIQNDYVYNKLLEHIGRNPPLIAYAYFTDMLDVISECHRVLRDEGVCAMIVGNSVLEHANIECDKILSEMAEEQFGFESSIWVGSVRYADVQVKGKMPVRESCIIMKKE